MVKLRRWSGSPPKITFKCSAFQSHRLVSRLAWLWRYRHNLYLSWPMKFCQYNSIFNKRYLFTDQFYNIWNQSRCTSSINPNATHIISPSSYIEYIPQIGTLWYCRLSVMALSPVLRGYIWPIFSYSSEMFVGIGAIIRMPWEPLYWHGLTLIPAWISNYIHYKVWDEITDQFPNFNDYTEWIGNLIPQFTGHVLTYPCWD